MLKDRSSGNRSWMCSEQGDFFTFCQLTLNNRSRNLGDTKQTTTPCSCTDWDNKNETTTYATFSTDSSWGTGNFADYLRGIGPTPFAKTETAILLADSDSSAFCVLLNAHSIGILHQNHRLTRKTVSAVCSIGLHWWCHGIPWVVCAQLLRVTRLMDRGWHPRISITIDSSSVTCPKDLSVLVWIPFLEIR